MIGLTSQEEKAAFCPFFLKHKKLYQNRKLIEIRKLPLKKFEVRFLSSISSFKLIHFLPFILQKPSII
jgi:hypothetical protein